MADTQHIVKTFASLDLQWTPQRINDLTKMVIQFEIRGTHALAFNTQLLGVHSMAFTTPDRTALFHLFNLTEHDAKACVDAIPSIDKSRNVESDPFNVFCVWLMHLARTQITHPDNAYQVVWLLAKYLNYRFFTSLINRYFKYGADESVMLATINSLSNRYEIVICGSWRMVIETRAKTLASTTFENIHTKTLDTATPDAKFLYIVSDTQSRIRDRVKNVADVYYTFHKNQIKIASVDTVQTDKEGSSYLINRATTFEALITSLCTDSVNVVKFVDDGMIQLVAGAFKGCPEALLRATLIDMSTLATIQVKEGTFSDQYTDQHGMVFYTGMRALITAIVETSMHYCFINKVSLKDKSKAWYALRNVYTASQTGNKEILSIKESVSLIIERYNRTERQATRASLRLSVILYVVLRCLKALDNY